MKFEDLVSNAIDIENYVCKERRVEIPCVVCPDLDNCERKSHQKTLQIENQYKLVKNTNSALLYLKIPTQDKIEEFLLERLWVALKNIRSKVGFTAPENGYNIGILILADHVNTHEKKEAVKTYLLGFEKNFIRSLMDGKMQLNQFIRQVESRFS